MIVFKRVFFKNFASYGGAGAEFILNSHQMTAIIGENGVGKTTFLNAICFALYGKTFNSTQKSKVINSINGKHLLVELDFKVNGVPYKIRRGMKPNIFEIYENGKMITQESSVKNYQEILENEILKINMKNFTQTVLVGTASFIPFMELTANDRRIVVENILGVEILTQMNSLLKNKMVLVSQEIQQVSSIIDSIKIKCDSELKQIRLLENIHKDSKEKNNKIIESNKAEIEKCQKFVDECLVQLKKIEPFEEKYDQLKEYRNGILSELSSINALLKNNQKSLNFLSTHDTCPMCQQKIGDEYKNDLGGKLNQTISEYKTKTDSLNEKIGKLDETEGKLRKVLEKKQKINNSLASYNSKISSYNRENKRLLEESKETNTTDEIDVHKRNILEMSKEAKIKIQRKKDLINKQHLMEFSETLLKDSGIKSEIIAKYLPVINHQINKYLERTDLYVKFEFDSQFNETIKARERDEYTYQNLSQGERRRLDMSILLTWRYIAELISQTNCNLLIVDEILDSSLDQGGADAVLGMLRDMKNLNIFVVSHRSEINDSRFDKYIKIKKVNQFSVVED